MFHSIRTAPELSQAITSTYVYDILIAVVFIGLMMLTANIIKWQPGRVDHSGAKRRVWFFTFMVMTLFASLAFGYAWLKHISVPAFASKYTLAMAIASIVSAVVYLGAGLLIVYLWPIGTKIQSIFPKKDK